MELLVRLNILKDAGQISEETYKSLIKVIEMFSNKWGIALTEENGAMLITHLSTAIERIKKGNIIDGIDAQVYKEIESHPSYEKCSKVIKDIEEQTEIKIPEGEETFIMMHLCTLFKTDL